MLKDDRQYRDAGACYYEEKYQRHLSAVSTNKPLLLASNSFPSRLSWQLFLRRFHERTRQGKH